MPMEFLRRSSQSFVLVAVDGLSRAKRLGSFVLAAWVIGKVEKPQSSSKYWRWSRSPKWFRFAMSYRSFSWRTKRQVRCKWECKLSSVLCMGLKSFSFLERTSDEANARRQVEKVDRQKTRQEYQPSSFQVQESFFGLHIICFPYVVVEIIQSYGRSEHSDGRETKPDVGD